MKLLIFTIFDQKADAFLPPFFLPNKELAIRTFTDCVNSDQHQFGQHPEDYTLFTIGEFDDSDSNIENYQTRRTCINGVSLVKSTQIETSTDEKQHDSPIQSGAKS